MVSSIMELTPKQAGRLLAIEMLSKKIKALEADLTVENYFDKIKQVTSLKNQLWTLSQELKQSMRNSSLMQRRQMPATEQQEQEQERLLSSSPIY